MKKKRMLREKKWHRELEKRNKEIADPELQEMRHQCTRVIDMLKVEMPKVTNRYINSIIDANYQFAHPLSYQLYKLTKDHPLPRWPVTLLDIVLLLPLLLLYILSLLLHWYVYLTGKIDREFLDPSFPQFITFRSIVKQRQSFEADMWKDIRNEPGEAYATARVVLSSSATLERVQQAINSSAENVRMLHKCFLAIGDEGKDFSEHSILV